MKLAYSTLGCPDWSLERVAEAAKEYGYEAVELRLLDGQVISPELVRSNVARIQKLFGSGKPPILGLGTSVRFSMSDLTERQKNDATAREFIDIAAGLGVPMIRIFGGRRPDDVNLAQGIANAVEGFNRLAPAAERAGITLALETHDDFSSAAVVAEAMKSIPSRSVAVIWDMHHTYRMGETVEQVWELIGDRIAHVHIKDARRKGTGDNWDLVLLEEGEVPVRAGVELLAKKGYSGYLSVEWEKMWHPEIPDPEIALPQHVERLKAYLA